MAEPRLIVTSVTSEKWKLRKFSHIMQYIGATKSGTLKQSCHHHRSLCMSKTEFDAWDVQIIFPKSAESAR